MIALDAPMQGDGCRAELFSEDYRDALRAACAEDPDIWDIYSINFGPPDGRIDRMRAFARAFGLAQAS